jgi:hypothetical protein
MKYFYFSLTSLTHSSLLSTPPHPTFNFLSSLLHSPPSTLLAGLFGTLLKILTSRPRKKGKNEKKKTDKNTEKTRK